MLSLRLGCVLGLACIAFAADKNVTFNIVNANISPDGFARNTVVVNGLFPGTTIFANKTDSVNIKVVNQLSATNMRQSTSIHWHGLFQTRTASEDGPAFVNQCPIAPGLTYEYNIPLNGQSGTFWYHSHLSSQYVDGLRGAFIVYDAQDPHKSLYDEDNANTVIQLGDWYHSPATALGDAYLNDVAGNEPVPDSGTINGVGRYVGGSNVPWTRINVVKGKKYRLRVINISAYASFTFGIEGHSLTIIEIDGVLTQPYTIDKFEIFAGQRYSVVVNANQPIANYWVAVPMDLQGASSNPRLDTDNVFAVLHYSGASSGDPTTDAKPPSGTLLEEYNLKPLVSPGAPGGSGNADHVIDLSFAHSTDSARHTQWTINGLPYKAPSVPTLLKILTGNATREADFGANENTLVLQQDEIVELRIHGSAGGHTHPFHLHGHVFDIVKGISGPANYINPPRRDVVGVGGSEVRIRFKADNPGPWFLHCHIDWHLEAGLAVVFAEAPDAQRTGTKSQIIKQSWRDLCTAYNALPASKQ